MCNLQKAQDLPLRETAAKAFLAKYSHSMQYDKTLTHWTKISWLQLVLSTHTHTKKTPQSCQKLKATDMDSIQCMTLLGREVP